MSISWLEEFNKWPRSRPHLSEYFPSLKEQEVFSSSIICPWIKDTLCLH